MVKRFGDTMMPGMNPKQMAKLMKQMGISTKELPVVRVVFEMDDRRLIIENPVVTEVNMQGQKTYQVVGEPKEETILSEEDVHLVMEKTGKSREEVVKVLEETDGDIAEAILKLSEE